MTSSKRAESEGATDRGSRSALQRKGDILAAAEEIMSEKGLADSSIAAIACKAGVVDSVIYQYFKGKQDLLFAIPAQRMQEALAQLNEHLKSIQDAESRLRKMVWFHLRYNDAHRGYARLLLMECRSAREFYATPAYGLIRKYAGILLSILLQGAESGAFRGDVDMRLVRDAILGTLDMETIGTLATGERENSEDDFEDIMALVRGMIVSPRMEEKKPDKQEVIVRAAEAVFAEKGFTRSKISDIAGRAGVADGTIYEYFESKEALLFAIPARRFDQYLREITEVFEIKDPLRKLRRLFKYHFSSFMNERQFLKVFLLHVQLNMLFYGTDAYRRFQKYYELIENIIEEGKTAGVFHQMVNPRVFRNMFLGVFSHMALRWLIVDESTDTDKMEEINQVTDLLTSAVAARGTV